MKKVFAFVLTLLFVSTALFVLSACGENKFTVKVSGGTVNGEAQVTVKEGESVTIKAEDRDNEIFSQWKDVEDGSVLSKSAEYTFKPEKDLNLAAEYTPGKAQEEETVKFTVTVVGGAKDEPSVIKVNEGGTVTVKGDPERPFLYWYVIENGEENIASYDSEYTFAPYKDITLYAYYSESQSGNLCTVSVSGGRLHTGATSGMFKKGTIVTVTAVHPIGDLSDPFEFWTDGPSEDNVVSNNSVYTFTVEKDINMVSWWDNYGRAPVAMTNNKLVIYAENNGLPGTYDKDVELAIEKKFYKDTGTSLDLVVEMCTTAELGMKVNGELAAGLQVDAMVQHWGSDTYIDAYLKSPASRDLTGVLRAAPNFKKIYYETDPDGYAYYTGVYEGALKGISSVSNNSAWGMLINATYMSKTDFDPAEYDVSNPNHKSLTFSEFKELVFQLKERNKNTLLTRVINATPWALDYVVAPALGGTTYNGYILTEDGRVVPSWSTEGYKKVLEFDRWLQENNLWVENPASRGVSIDDFAAGKNAICLGWPDAINNIEYARWLKYATNMDAIVLAPIVPDGSPEGTKGTNARMQTASSGFIMPTSSTQVDLMAMYLDWLYTPNENGEYENYELAKYGIEGVHWEKGTKQYNGETIKTWDYPAAKKAEFKVTKPYSGKFLIISNYTLEDRVWADYNDQELAWWFAQNTMPTSPDHYDLEGVNFRSFTVNDGALKALDTDMNEKYTSMRGYAWSASKMPDGQTIASMHDALTSEFTGKYKPLIDFYTQEYIKFLSTKPARV